MVADVLHQQSPMPTLVSMFSTYPAPMFRKIPAKFKENQKKIYYCQRCLNHAYARPRKNHKCECPYADCTCEKCLLVEKRRILNIRLQNYNQNYNIENEFDNKCSMDDDDDKKPKGERVPNCQKCGQHGRKSRLKGHKRNCPFRECKCAKCAVVTERQKLMADQIKIRRRQRKDTLMNLTREHITSSIHAAAAFSNNQINLSNLKSFLYGSINTSPQSLLSSPTSSDASSYSPSLPFTSSTIPLILPPSADSSPNSQTPAQIGGINTAPAPLGSRFPINPTVSSSQSKLDPQIFQPMQLPLLGLGGHGPDAAALFQTILDQYRLLEEAASMSISSSPSKDDESGDEDGDGLNSNSIIDVCTV